MDMSTKSEKNRFFSDEGQGGLLIFVLSDSIGSTAMSMASAALSQFDVVNPTVKLLPKIESIAEVRDYLSEHLRSKSTAVVFYTIADLTLRGEVSTYLKGMGLPEVDLLGPPILTLAKALGEEPHWQAGANRKLDEAYFRRVEAMDFAVDHDDGRRPEGYKEADIILMGVSRTSKTPLSMYLASCGYKVANLPLAPGMKPPKEIFEVDSWRIFGLMSSVHLLSDIRARRLGAALEVAGDYASEEYIERDLAEARALMRKLGCIVVRTDNRAIEETAAEIIQYFEMGLEATRAREIQEDE
ncbi:MAG: pyruvate, water dikinase regulatory protein [Coriobacteriales bacterium]|jgi:regulator of PEP synthase PpsR (kinase-PPPase family)